ncbi:MAG: tRNA uracil 4-sulfurtransferase ThiI [Arsenophonus sp.]
MKFIIKLFPEITIKSESVRLRFIKILSTNIFNILKVLDDKITINRHWSDIEVFTKKNTHYDEICNALTKIPGIHHILFVEEHKFLDLNHIFKLAYTIYSEKLNYKTFCVRVKRCGKHNFTSTEVESYLGRCLNQHISSANVKLNHPDITINLEIKKNKVIFVKSRTNGICGFPIGTQGDVLSLISGGFDSGVSSYMLIRRGCRVHYCLFNIGGLNHEIGAKQVAYHLWHNFSRSHKVRFIVIDFTPIVTEIIKKIDNSHMAVVLKRMMVRAASKIADRYDVQALITGESLGQVSSQTLTNLRLIDNVTDRLILRPLISYDKENIINISREIGTEHFSSTIPEFCGIFSKKPTVKAEKEKIEEQEANFYFSILDDAVVAAQNIDIRQIPYNIKNKKSSTIEVVTTFSIDDIILDIRSPDEQEARPLKLDNVKIKLLPFYKLNSQFCKLPAKKIYLLYCERGVMSRLQAIYLHEQGFKNVKVYHP